MGYRLPGRLGQNEPLRVSRALSHFFFKVFEEFLVIVGRDLIRHHLAIQGDRRCRGVHFLGRRIAHFLFLTGFAAVDFCRFAILFS